MVLSCCDVSSYKQDSVWSWFVCLCATICMILTVGFSFAVGVLFPVLMDSFDESRERTAWVFSILVGFCCLSGPFVGAFLNRFGIRIATVTGCLLCSAGLAIGSFASHNMIAILFITFSIPFGLGAGVIYTTATVIGSHYFVTRRSIALGVITASQGLGTMILGPVLQALEGAVGWRNLFRVIAALLFVASLTGFILHKGTSPPMERKEREPPSSKFRFNLNILKSPRFIIILIQPGFYTFSRMIPYVHLIKHCDDLGIPANKSATLFLFLGIFATFGRLGGGLLCNLNFIKARLLFQVSIFVAGSSTMIMTLAKTYGALVAYAIVFSVTDGMMVTTYLIEQLNSIEDARKASLFGFGMLSAGVSAMSSPPISGLMADKANNYIGAFLLAGSFGILCSLIPFLLLCLREESSNRQVIKETEEQEDSEFARGIDEDEQELMSKAAMVEKPGRTALSLVTVESSI